MKHLKRLWIVLAVLLVFLAACTPAPTLAPSVTPTQAPPATETPRPSLSPAPTSTSIPTATATLTLTLTLPPSATFTATVTSTPRPSFAGFQVDYTQFTSYGMLMGFHIPGLKENYRLQVDGVDYQCNINTKAPDRLYCSGQQFKAGQTVKLAFLPLQGDNTPIFETNYQVVPNLTGSIDPRTLVALGTSACEARGVHVTCETEYRNNEGGYCIVSTCVDLCGYYYSVDTCPVDSITHGFYPMTGTPPMPPVRVP